MKTNKLFLDTILLIIKNVEDFLKYADVYYIMLYRVIFAWLLLQSVVMQKPDIMNPKLSTLIYFCLLLYASIFFNKLEIKILKLTDSEPNFDVSTALTRVWRSLSFLWKQESRTVAIVWIPASAGMTKRKCFCTNTYVVVLDAKKWPVGIHYIGTFVDSCSRGADSVNRSVWANTPLPRNLLRPARLPRN